MLSTASISTLAMLSLPSIVVFSHTVTLCRFPWLLTSLRNRSLGALTYLTCIIIVFTALTVPLTLSWVNLLAILSTFRSWAFMSRWWHRNSFSWCSKVLIFFVSDSIDLIIANRGIECLMFFIFCIVIILRSLFIVGFDIVAFVGLLNSVISGLLVLTVRIGDHIEMVAVAVASSSIWQPHRSALWSTSIGWPRSRSCLS